MTIRKLNMTPLSHAAMLVVGIGFGVWLVAASPAGAITDGKQLLSGGNSSGSPATLFTSPGLGNIYGPDFPGVGKGERAAQLRMPAAGILSMLRVKVTTQMMPTSGAMVVMVRKNEADTTLTCQVPAGMANCNVNTSVSLAVNDRFAVRVSNNFGGAGAIAFSYTLILD